MLDLQLPQGFRSPVMSICLLPGQRKPILHLHSHHLLHNDTTFIMTVITLNLGIQDRAQSQHKSGDCMELPSCGGRGPEPYQAFTGAVNSPDSLLQVCQPGLGCICCGAQRCGPLEVLCLHCSCFRACCLFQLTCRAAYQCVRQYLRAVSTTVLPTGRTLGRTPSTLLLEPEKPAIFFLL